MSSPDMPDALASGSDMHDFRNHYAGVDLGEQLLCHSDVDVPERRSSKMQHGSRFPARQIPEDENVNFTQERLGVPTIIDAPVTAVHQLVALRIVNPPAQPAPEHITTQYSAEIHDPSAERALPAIPEPDDELVVPPITSAEQQIVPLPKVVRHRAPKTHSNSLAAPRLVETGARETVWRRLMHDTGAFYDARRGMYDFGQVEQFRCALPRHSTGSRYAEHEDMRQALCNCHDWIRSDEYRLVLEKQDLVCRTVEGLVVAHQSAGEEGKQGALVEAERAVEAARQELEQAREVLKHVPRSTVWRGSHKWQEHQTFWITREQYERTLPAELRGELENADRMAYKRNGPDDWYFPDCWHPPMEGYGFESVSAGSSDNAVQAKIFGKFCFAELALGVVTGPEYPHLMSQKIEKDRARRKMLQERDAEQKEQRARHKQEKQAIKAELLAKRKRAQEEKRMQQQAAKRAKLEEQATKKVVEQEARKKRKEEEACKKAAKKNLKKDSDVLEFVDVFDPGVVIVPNVREEVRKHGKPLDSKKAMAMQDLEAAQTKLPAKTKSQTVIDTAVDNFSKSIVVSVPSMSSGGGITVAPSRLANAKNAKNSK